MLMAVSGVVFIVFVLVHMYGNLKAFSGHDAYNEYAEHLRSIGEPELPHEGMLWVLRVGADRARWSSTWSAPSCCGAGPRRARTVAVRHEAEHLLDVLLATGCAGAG